MAIPEKVLPKILIVDDVDTNRFVLKDIVSDMGYTPLLAENGVQALKIIERIAPQLIISDIAMPQMDGLVFCEKLKSDPKTRDIPLVFISAFDDTKDVVEGLKMGAVDYIAKPFLPEIVKARIGLHLKLFETQRELAESNRILQASIKNQLNQIEMEKRNMLYALTRVARENASFDNDHMDRLSYNCKIMAEALQLTKEYGNQISDGFIDTIYLAAPLCDLGNAGIPGSILQKSGVLSDEEKSTIRKHTIIGGRIIKDIMKVEEHNDFLQMSYDIAMSHHEYYDGSGYPEGKTVQNIPLAAQIVAVVSAYCAMTEKRSYREAYSSEEAMAMIKNTSGTKYTPQLCDVMGMIVRQLK